MNRTFKGLLPEPLKRIYRQRQGYSDAILEPIDALARAIDGRGYLPPLRVRRNSGPLASFEAHSAGFVSLIAATCGFDPGDRILDIGCGCGGVALQLQHNFRDQFDERSSYTGVDIHAPSIAWARKNIQEKDRRFNFKCLDVRNPQYNPGGSTSAAEYSFPFADRSFDTILAKSLFTHMRPKEVDNYLGEVARLLTEEGHCLATFFLLNERTRTLRKQGALPLSFDDGDGVWRFADADVPERAIAYEEDYILALLRKHHLELARPVLYGHQDVLLIRQSPLP